MTDGFGSRKNEIAVLLPLSGSDAELGNRMKLIIEFVFNTDANIQEKYRLTFYDEASDKDLNNHINMMIARKTKIILGPLYSRTISKISPMIKETDITMISLSNDSRVAGRNIFVFGHEVKKQSDLLMNYVTSSSFNEFILMLPATPKSAKLAKFLGDMIRDKKLNLVDTIYYSNNPESINRAVEKANQAVDRINEDPFESSKPVILVFGKKISSLKEILKNIRDSNLDRKAFVAGDNRLDMLSDDLPKANYIYIGGSKIIDKNYASEFKKLLKDGEFTSTDRLAFDLAYFTLKNIPTEFDRDLFLSNLNSNSPKSTLGGNVFFKNNIAQRSYLVMIKEGERYRILSQ